MLYQIKVISYNFMDVEEKVLPILFYYKMRGQAQAIRGLFSYLQVQFIEIHLERFEQQRKTLPPSIINRLKKQRIDKNLLPAILDNQQLICDTYPIMAYLCYKYEHEQLLGNSIEDKAKLQEIIDIYLTKQPQSMGQLFRLSDFSANHAEDEIYIEMKKSYINVMNNSEYIKEVCLYIQSRNPQKYILENISILDFLFLESSIYMTGTFAIVKKKYEAQKHPKQKQISSYNRNLEELLVFFGVMENYRDRMSAEPFYVRSKDSLESFSIITLFSVERTKGIRKIWRGNPKFVQ